MPEAEGAKFRAQMTVGKLPSAAGGRLTRIAVIDDYDIDGVSHFVLDTAAFPDLPSEQLLKELAQEIAARVARWLSADPHIRRAVPTSVSRPT